MSRIPFETGAGLWWYDPITPSPDSDELAQRPRLILYHDRKNGPRLSLYPSNGEMQAGWVVGVGEPMTMSHEPGCDINVGKGLCSCSPYSRA